MVFNLVKCALEVRVIKHLEWLLCRAVVPVDNVMYVVEVKTYARYNNLGNKFFLLLYERHSSIHGIITRQS